MQPTLSSKRVAPIPKDGGPVSTQPAPNPPAEPPKQPSYQSTGSPRAARPVPSFTQFIFGLPIRSVDQQVSKNTSGSSSKSSDAPLLPSQTVAEESTLIQVSTSSSSSVPAPAPASSVPPPSVPPTCTPAVVNEEVATSENATSVIPQRTAGVLAEVTSHVSQPAPSSCALSVPIVAGPSLPATTVQSHSTSLPEPDINPHGEPSSRPYKLPAPQLFDDFLPYSRSSDPSSERKAQCYGSKISSTPPLGGV